MESRRAVDLITALLNEPLDTAILRDHVAWTSIKKSCGPYGVAPLVAFTARPHVSGEDRQWCDLILSRSWKRHDYMLAQLQHIIARFAATGIPAIALKGPMLARRYYTPPFLRKPSMDLDLAVAARDLARACELLTDLGYEPEVSMPEALVRSHHVVLTHPSGPNVELHFRLSHQTLGIKVEEFFERAIPCHLPDGREVLVLSPADQILHLVLHLAHSRFGTLFHFYEIKRVCFAETVDARSEAISRAVKHGFCGALRMTELAFRTLLGIPFLPSDISIPQTWLNWRLTETLFREMEAWSEPGRSLTLAARLEGRWLDFQMTDTPLHGARMLANIAQTTRYRLKQRAWGTTRKIGYTP